MELKEIITVEHAMVKVRLIYLLKCKIYEEFPKICEFLIHHFEIEEKYLLQLLNYEENLKLKIDHETLIRLSKYIKNLIETGEENLFLNQLETFLNTLILHFEKEEEILLKIWNKLNKKEKELLINKKKEEIEKFGLEKYLNFMGFSSLLY